MGRPRLQLHELFKLMTAYVYFQPPTAMEYPCILYTLDADFVEYADNIDYHQRDGYQVTIIDRDPDSVLRGMVASLPMCRFQRWYVAEDLNHFVYNLFF